jgi:hypothetical protein
MRSVDSSIPCHRGFFFKTTGKESYFYGEPGSSRLRYRQALIDRVSVAIRQVGSENAGNTIGYRLCRPPSGIVAVSVVPLTASDVMARSPAKKRIRSRIPMMPYVPAGNSSVSVMPDPLSLDR